MLNLSSVICEELFKSSDDAFVTTRCHIFHKLEQLDNANVKLLLTETQNRRNTKKKDMKKMSDLEEKLYKSDFSIRLQLERKKETKNE